MTDNTLPAPFDGTQQKYVRVTPTQEDTVIYTEEMARLHALCASEGRAGYVGQLRRTLGFADEASTIECLLLSPGNAEAIEYYFGLPDDRHGSVDALERILHLLFPDTCEIRQVRGVLENRSDLVIIGDQPHHRQNYPDVVGVEFVGLSERRDDWQASLQQFVSVGSNEPAGSHASRSDDSQTTTYRSPLNYIIETIADSNLPVVYQALLTPLENWEEAANTRITALKNGYDTHKQALITTLAGDDGPVEIPESDSNRIEQIKRRSKHRSFVANARLAILAPEDDYVVAEGLASQLTSAFGRVSGEYHSVTGRLVPESGDQLLEQICQQQTHPKNYERLTTKVPFSANTSRGIVADQWEVPHFVAIDGANVTPEARRALEATPPDQTAVPRPPDSILSAFRGSGMALGYALDSHGQRSDAIRLPPDRQNEHLAIVGGTGAGKSTTLLSGILSNRAATAGADIVIDPKGGQFVEEYLRCHYAQTGSLEDVYYFDLAEWLPAFSFFDISSELAAGVPRHVAVEDRVSHYEEVLAQVTGTENYRDAIRSPDLLKDVLRLRYDPKHGSETFRHREFHRLMSALSTDSTIPAVSDEDLARRLQGQIETADPRTFENVRQGALNRIEKISSNPHLNRIFNHDADADIQFDFASYLNEDVTLIFDTGRLRGDVQRGLAIVILSQLWTALRRRKRQAGSASQPLVNLYIEEAPDLADSNLLDTLLSEGRAFDIAVTLALQFPAQMEAVDERTYAELLNDVGTFVTGRVNDDAGVARRFANAAMDAPAVANRLSNLSRGQWLVDLPGEFNDKEPEPFLLESLSLPKGHPDQQASPPPGYAEASDAVIRRTLNTAAITLGHSESDTPADEEQTTTEEPTKEGPQQPSIFELTDRLPACVQYLPASDSLQCTSCDRRYAPVIAGMRKAISCCHDIADVDRADIPVCSYHLKLTPDEIEAADWRFRQLVFLQLVNDAQQQRYDQIEYDIVWDSMIRLQEYVGIEQAAIDELIEAGLLAHDGDHPHRLYSIKPAGRRLLNEKHSYGVHFGHLKGDLGESSQHVCGVEAARRYFISAYAEDPASAVTTVQPYYELTDQTIPAAEFMGGEGESSDEYSRRVLDVAGLDADGDIVLTCEVERINNDYRTAVPKDYDTMAACEPKEAHWVVLTQSAGHDVLAALQSPPDGNARVEKSYSTTTPPNQFRIDRPGLTHIYSIKRVQRRLRAD